MKKVIILAVLMVMSFAGCSNNSGKPNTKPDSNNSTVHPDENKTAATPAEIEEAIKKAIGKDNYLCDTDISAEALAERYGLDMTKVEAFTAKENSNTSLNLDVVIILKVKDGYAADAVKAINGGFEETVSYIRLYPFVVAKVEGARLYQNGNIVAMILAGARASDNASAEDDAKLASAEYKKIDEAWKTLFGFVPKNQIVIPEGSGNGGGIIDPGDDDQSLGG